MSQYGGPNGELGASLRYLAQRFSMPDRRVAGLLTDIGTEERAHLEMVCTMIHQLTRGLTPEQLFLATVDDSGDVSLTKKEEKSAGKSNVSIDWKAVRHTAGRDDRDH